MNLNIHRFWRNRSVTISEYDPTFKATYLGNVVTNWAKSDGCTDKPLATLWNNFCHSGKTYAVMKVTVTSAGLKALTKEHGLTEYWAHRITYCGAHKNYPKLFCWVYRHEGKKLKQELRCHAVLCSKEGQAKTMAYLLNAKLAEALQEFRREKICRQKARLSLANCVYDNPSLPRRKILLSTGSANYRPPLERSKSAPKLMAIEEEESEEETSEIIEEEDEFIEVDIVQSYLLDDMTEDKCKFELDGRNNYNQQNNNNLNVITDPFPETSSTGKEPGVKENSLKVNSSPNDDEDEDVDNISEESGYSEETNRGENGDVHQRDWTMTN